MFFITLEGNYILLMVKKYVYFHAVHKYPIHSSWYYSSIQCSFFLSWDGFLNRKQQILPRPVQLPSLPPWQASPCDSIPLVMCNWGKMRSHFSVKNKAKKDGREFSRAIQKVTRTFHCNCNLWFQYFIIHMNDTYCDSF